MQLKHFLCSLCQFNIESEVDIHNSHSDCPACRSVLTGAQLLSEGLADRGGFASGFDWAAEQLRQAGLHRVAAEVRTLDP